MAHTQELHRVTKFPGPDEHLGDRDGVAHSALGFELGTSVGMVYGVNGVYVAVCHNSPRYCGGGDIRKAIKDTLDTPRVLQ